MSDWAAETVANVHPQPPARLSVSYLLVYLFTCCKQLPGYTWVKDRFGPFVRTRIQSSSLFPCLPAPRHLPQLPESGVRGLIHFGPTEPAVGWGHIQSISGGERMIVLSGEPFRVFPGIFLELCLGHLFSCSTLEEPSRREDLLFDFQRSLHHLESSWTQL